MSVVDLTRKITEVSIELQDEILKINTDENPDHESQQTLVQLFELQQTINQINLLLVSSKADSKPVSEDTTQFLGSTLNDAHQTLLRISQSEQRRRGKEGNAGKEQLIKWNQVHVESSNGTVAMMEQGNMETTVTEENGNMSFGGQEEEEEQQQQQQQQQKHHHQQQQVEVNQDFESQDFESQDFESQNVSLGLSGSSIVELNQDETYGLIRQKLLAQYDRERRGLQADSLRFAYTELIHEKPMVEQSTIDWLVNNVKPEEIEQYVHTDQFHVEAETNPANLSWSEITTGIADTQYLNNVDILQSVMERIQLHSKALYLLEDGQHSMTIKTESIFLMESLRDHLMAIENEVKNSLVSASNRGRLHAMIRQCHMTLVSFVFEDTRVKVRQDQRYLLDIASVYQHLSIVVQGDPKLTSEHESNAEFSNPGEREMAMLVNLAIALVEDKQNQSELNGEFNHLRLLSTMEKTAHMIMLEAGETALDWLLFHLATSVTWMIERRKSEFESIKQQGGYLGEGVAPLLSTVSSALDVDHDKVKAFNPDGEESKKRLVDREIFKVVALFIDILDQIKQILNVLATEDELFECLEAFGALGQPSASTIQNQKDTIQRFEARFGFLVEGIPQWLTTTNALSK